MQRKTGRDPCTRRRAVDFRIGKDTDIAAMMRWVFRWPGENGAIEETEILFKRVLDGKDRVDRPCNAISCRRQLICLLWHNAQPHLRGREKGIERAAECHIYTQASAGRHINFHVP